MNTADWSANSQNAATTDTRRSAERFNICSASYSATWLADGQLIDVAGKLVDISSGGFGARMVRVPPRGHLLHARLSLKNPHRKTVWPVEADARVCGARCLSSDADSSPDWIVNLAIESIHLADEQRLVQAIGVLRTEDV